MIIDALTLSIEAAYRPRREKLAALETLRIKLETAKQLIRTAHELNTFQTKTYLALEKRLQEISKMTNGWIRYSTEKGA